MLSMCMLLKQVNREIRKLGCHKDGFCLMLFLFISANSYNNILDKTLILDRQEI